MSDSEMDSDLAVEQYDVEDELNAYESPVFQTVDKVTENLPSNLPLESTHSNSSEFINFLFTVCALTVYYWGAKRIIYISSYSFVNVKAHVVDKLEWLPMS